MAKKATKAATKTTKVETTKTPKTEKAPMWESTGKYSPKAIHTMKTWKEIEGILPCSVEDMAKCEHKNPGFIGYLKRREAIQLVSGG